MKKDKNHVPGETEDKYNGVPFLLAGGNPNWTPREPFLGLRLFRAVLEVPKRYARTAPRFHSKTGLIALETGLLTESKDFDE